MSTFRVEAVKLDDVQPHPNAERLELAVVKGWNCVVQKGRYKAGDVAIYIPIDSVLAPETESKLFPPDSKVRLNNSRIRTIKLRGAISQGLIVDPTEVGITKAKVGEDYASKIGVTKYEPPVKESPQFTAGSGTRKQSNPHFRKYTGVENAKNYVDGFQSGEEVCVSEKIHGTNFRAGYVQFHADTLWKKVKKLLGLAPKFEFVYGSHSVQLQSKMLYTGFYDKNVYAEAVAKYRLAEILKPGEVVYGEIYGADIQKGYTYGCAEGERKLVLFDLMKDDKYVDVVAFNKWAEERQLPRVPILYRGPFDWAKIKSLTVGDSVLAPTQKVREGVVVKPIQEAVTYFGRKMLKFISDEYLLKDQTEFH